MKKNYECLMILEQGLAEEDVARETKAIRETLSGCEISFREMGLRELSYPISKKTRGFYLLCHFQCEPEKKAELDSRLRLNPAVLRHLILSVSNPPAQESVPPAADVPETPLEGAGETAASVS